MRETKKNRPIYIKQTKDLYDSLIKEFPTLRITDSHAVKHDYYRKMGYYPNLTGTFRGRMIFVLHKTGKGALPARMRFIMNHLGKLQDGIWVVPKESELFASGVPEGKKETVKTANETKIVLITKEGLKLINSFKHQLVERIANLNRKVPVFGLIITNIGTELQVWGYVHDRTQFLEILSFLGECCDQIESEFGKLTKDMVAPKVRLPSGEWGYHWVDVDSDGIKLVHNRKGIKKTIRYADLLFLYKTNYFLEIYGENWLKVTIPLDKASNGINILKFAMNENIVQNLIGE